MQCPRCDLGRRRKKPSTAEHGSTHQFRTAAAAPSCGKATLPTNPPGCRAPRYISHERREILADPIRYRFQLPGSAFNQKPQRRDRRREYPSPTGYSQPRRNLLSVVRSERTGGRAFPAPVGCFPRCCSRSSAEATSTRQGSRVFSAPAGCSQQCRSFPPSLFPIRPW